jgi:hypothetical protein
MTSERAHAYRLVVGILRELGPSKLTSSEQQRIRDAADALIFSGSLATDQAAQDAVQDIGALGRHLVESDRWSARRVARLLDAVHACGPVSALPVREAA